jgi:hypothetical protein
LRLSLVNNESKYQSDEKVIVGTLINYVKKDDKYTLTIKGKEKIKATYYFCPLSVSGFHSASNRNEYQGIFSGLNCGWCVQLTNLPFYLRRTSM